MHAWCLTPFSYRLLVATERANLADGMRYLNSVHSQGLHRRRRASGQLFEGRYDSRVVDPARALFQAAADVLLEPVRVGCVADVGDWRWSSYHATLGLSPAPAWLDVHDLLHPFDDDHTRAAAAFDDALRRHPVTPEDPDAPPTVYADAAFIARLVASNQPPDEDDGIVFARLRPSLRELRAAHADRNEAMRVAYRMGYSQKEIARYFNVHTTTVSRAVAAGATWARMGSSSHSAVRYAGD